MRQHYPGLRGPLGEAQLAALRYRYVAWRHPALRGTRMTLGAGAHLMISPSARIQIAPGFHARRDLTLLASGGLKIGAGMFCNRGVLLAAFDDVEIGESVRVGERVSIIDSNHVIEPLSDMGARFEEYETAPIRIGDRVLIGANCVVLAGVSIGDDAVIGAGSVVTRDIPAGALATGVPARARRDLLPQPL